MEAILFTLLWLLLTGAWIASLVEAIANRKAGWAIVMFVVPPVAWIYVFFLPRFVRESRRRREHLVKGRRKLRERIQHLERELEQRPPATR